MSKNSYLSFWQWHGAIYCPYWSVHLRPHLTLLKDLKNCFFLHTGFWKPSCLVELTTTPTFSEFSRWRTTSIKQTNSPFLARPSSPHHLLLMNRCCFWEEYQELSGLLIHLTSSTYAWFQIIHPSPLPGNKIPAHTLVPHCLPDSSWLQCRS